MTVSSNLPEATVNGIVADHDPDSLFAKKVRKVEVFKTSSTSLVAAGLNYGDPAVNMPVGADSKTIYTSIASDDDNPGVSVNYPVEIPGNGQVLTLADRAELNAFITAVNSRLNYIYGDVENSDGSYGLVGYSGQIFAASSEAQLDAIVDARQ